MAKLSLKGKQEFLGMEIPVLYGGFGDNQKVILASTIADIHNMDLGHINELINNNLEEFEFGVDILDIKSAIVCNDSRKLSEYGLSSRQVNASKNIYLLSEQGYMALVNLMKNQLARDIRKQLRREYFSMKDAIMQQQGQALPTDYLTALKQLVASEEEKKKLSEEKAEAERILMIQEPKVQAYEHLMNSDGNFKWETVASILEISRNDMLKKLREHKILKTDAYEIRGVKRYGTAHNTPYSQYEKYFDTITMPVEGKARTTTYCKPAGLDFIRKMIDKLGILKKEGKK